MANLKFGSTGADVKKLQQALGFTGKDVDGIFGEKTQKAVKDYQREKGLAVDGIAGVKTQSSLYGSGTKSASAGSGNTKKITTPSGFTYDAFTYDQFKESDALNQAWAALGQLQGNAPGEWVDPYKDKYMGYLDQYEKRDPFSYDVNSDALYQQYKDQYTQQGQMAMMDTMGQAAAMTGGYGNSYAQTVGQQVYNQHLGQLNAIVPELYSMAYDRYQQEGQDLLNMHSLYRGLSDQDYSQYLGSVDKYFKELDAASSYANTLYGKEYGEWSDKTKMDYDLWNANTSIQQSDYQMLKNQQFQASENAKSRSASSSKVGDNTPKYKDLDVGSSAYNTIVSAVNKVSTLGELKALTEQYLALGYNPKQINALTESKATELADKNTPNGPGLAPHQTGSLGRYTY